MTLTKEREGLFQTTIHMSKTAKYANTMNIRSNPTELFSTSVTMAYKCTVFKKSMFLKWIFDHVLSWRHLNVTSRRSNIVNGLTELGGNWSVKLTVHFDSSVNYRWPTALVIKQLTRIWIKTLCSDFKLEKGGDVLGNILRKHNILTCLFDVLR